MNKAVAPVPWYKQFWPWFIISIPLATVIACIITIWIAVTHDVILVSDDYYQEGIDINRQLQRDQVSVSQNIHANVLFSEESRQVTVFLNSDNNTQHRFLTLTLSAQADAMQDQRIEAVASNTHLYRASLEKVPAGRFYLTIEPDDRNWRLKQAIVLPDASPIRVD